MCSASTKMKSTFTSTSHESSDSRDNDLESQKKQDPPSTARWIVLVTIAGLVVSGLVLVVVLFPLLSTTTKSQDIDQNNTISRDDERWESADLKGFHNYVVENIEGAMNFSVGPCDDFYEFACGSWKIHNPPPKGVSRWSNFEDMTVTIWDLMQEQLEKVVVEANALPAEEENTPSHPKVNRSFLGNGHPFIADIVGVYYSTCENDTHLSSLGAAPLKEVLEKMDKMYDSKLLELQPLEAFQDMLEYVHHELTVHAFFSWKVEVDNSIANNMVIELTTPILDFLPQGTNVEENEELLAIYKTYAVEILEIVGTHPDNDPETEANIIVDLLKIYQPLSGSPLVNVTKISELNSLAPFLNWHKYFNKGFNKVGAFINEDERILSLIQDYLVSLSEKITSEIFNNGSQRLYTYLRWQVVQYYSQFLHKPARDAILPLFDSISGENTKVLPHFRFRPCIKELEDRLGIPMAYLLLETVKQQLPEGADVKDMIRKVQNMAHNIRESYISYISSFSWLSNSAKNVLINKLSYIKILVGYPSILDNLSSLQSMYKPLEFDKGQLLQNQINLLSFNQRRKMHFLRQPDTYTEWEVLSPMSLISFYVYRRNTLLIPLGGFMHPLYTTDLPDALSYATMGMFIGHEIGHSIDFVGRTRDIYGRTNATLWDNSTVSDFVQRVLCRVNEYTERYYPIEGLLTIAEVMADDGSVRTAYQTIHDQIQSTRFPNALADFMTRLNLSPDQFFFLYYAQLFCTASAPGVPLKGIAHYPPHPVRVQATLANTPDFHKAFNCPKGSYMNPIRKQTCDIW